MPHRRMMIEEILVLAPLKSIAKIAEKVAKENLIRAKVVFCSSNEVAIDWAKNYVSKGCRVIVSRGGMAMTVRKTVDVPVINIEVTLDDFSAAVEKASKVNSIVGVMINAKIQHFFPEISNRYHINLINLQVAPGGDFIDAINSAILNEHIDTLVCGVAPSLIAESMNFPYAAIESNEYSINLALQKAQKMVAQKPSERVKNISSFFDGISLGIIVTDLWRGVVTSGSTPDNIVEYWSNILKKVSESEEWNKNYIQKNQLSADFMPYDVATKYMQDYENKVLNK